MNKKNQTNKKKWGNWMVQCNLFSHCAFPPAPHYDREIRRKGETRGGCRQRKKKSHISSQSSEIEGENNMRRVKMQYHPRLPWCLSPSLTPVLSQEKGRIKKKRGGGGAICGEKRETYESRQRMEGRKWMRGRAGGGGGGDSERAAGNRDIKSVISDSSNNI